LSVGLTDYGAVRIQKDDGATVGTGIVIGGGRVLTTAHVVQYAGGAGPRTSVVIVTSAGVFSPASVETWIPPEDGDIAVLVVTRPDLLPEAHAWGGAQRTRSRRPHPRPSARP
jgi:Trypsin-like peptidase domain